MCCCVFCLQGVVSARTEEGGQGVRRDCVWGGGEIKSNLSKDRLPLGGCWE